jgi:hypothetical protein
MNFSWYGQFDCSTVEADWDSCTGSEELLLLQEVKPIGIKKEQTARAIFISKKYQIYLN